MRTSLAPCVQTGWGKAGSPLTRMEPSLSSIKQAPFFHCTIAPLAAAHTFLLAEISRHALKEKFGQLVDFEFSTEMGLGEPTNRFPLVWEKSSNGKWLRTALEKTVEVPVFHAEMIVTWWVLSISRQSTRHLINMHFCVWLRTLCRLLVVEGSVIRSWCVAKPLYSSDLAVRKETRGSSELICRGTLRKRPDFGPSADSACPLRFKVRPQSFSHLHCLTLRSKWHCDRSLATWRESSCSTIHRRSSLGLSGYHSRWAPPGSSDSPLRDPSFRKEARHHHSAQLSLLQGPWDAASSC